MSRPQRITSRNARFQQWQTLLTNRTKRGRAGEFVVQGVRPIRLAVEHGWDVHTWLSSTDGLRSSWARELVRDHVAEHVQLAPELLAELGEKDEQAPELLAVVGMRPDDLDRLPDRRDLLLVVLDRPTSPGNIGTIIRSADAFGAHGVVITGHAADPYDPKAVRACTGSLFAVPVIRVPSATEVLAHVERLRARGVPARVVGTDETGTVEVMHADLTAPTVVVTGNETTGLSSAWRAAVDEMVRIPIGGAASSLNAASATSVVLYEASRQRLAAAQAPR